MQRRKKQTPTESFEDEFRKAFGFIVRPLETVRRNPRRALAQPRTTLDRLTRTTQNSLDQQLQRESIDAFLSRMLELIPHPAQEVLSTIQLGIARDRAKLGEDTAGAQLLALYQAADAVGPISPVKFIFANPEDEAVDEWSVLSKIDVAQRSRGEKRVLALLDAIPDLLEKVYLRYLQAIWAMSFLANGKWPSRPPGTFNSLVDQVLPRVHIYPALVDSDATHLRNAVAHRHFEYLPSKRSIKLSNPPKNWHVILTQKAFEARVARIWCISTTHMKTLRSIAMPDLMLRSGMFERFLLLRDRVRSDPTALPAPPPDGAEHPFDSLIIRKSPPPGTDLWFLNSKLTQ